MMKPIHEEIFAAATAAGIPLYEYGIGQSQSYTRATSCTTGSALAGGAATWPT